MKALIIIASLFLMQVSFAQEISTTPKVWTLNDCLIYAVENNITIKDASLDKEQAVVDYNATKSSRLPNLFGATSQSFSNGNAIDPITSDFVNAQIYSTNASLNSNMTLYQGNQINNQIAQSELLKNQFLFLEEVAKNDIIVSILENYLQILYAKEGITIAENNLITSEKEVAQAKAKLDAGSIALSDYTEAQSQAATNRFAIITAKNTYQQNIITLKQLLELDPTETIEIETLSNDIDYVTIELDKMTIYNKALGIMPEVNASKIALEASEKELDIVKGAYLPTLSLSSSLVSGYTSVNDATFTDQFNINISERVGLSLTIPIFNRNQTKAAVKTAELNIEKAQISEQTTIKEVYKKVETAFQNALSTQEQLIASEASKIAAEQSYKLAQKKYDLGGLSTTDLVLSQNTYTNAQQNYLQAKYLSVLYHQLLQFYQGNDIKL
jgi:outer membrane protein